MAGGRRRTPDPRRSRRPDSRAPRRAGLAAEPDELSTAPLRLAFVPGVTPDTWVRRWRDRVPRTPLELTAVTEREQLRVVYDGRADVGLVRVSEGQEPVDTDLCSVIPLYRETPVVVVPVDHPVTAYDEVDQADLDGETFLPDPATGRHSTPQQTVQLVAEGRGIAVLPRSVARLCARKDVAARPVTGVAETRVALVWLSAATDARIETFIGIVRGRTERSSRGVDQPTRGAGRRKR